MRWSWRSCRSPPPLAGEPEEEQEPAAGHHHLPIEHGDVETESSSEHWPGLPVEEAVHVEDPAGEQTCSAAEEAPTPEPVAWVMEEEVGTGSDSDVEEAEVGSAGGAGRSRRRRDGGRRRRRRRRGGHPVRMVVGTAAAMLLALVALVASWRRQQHRRGQ